MIKYKIDKKLEIIDFYNKNGVSLTIKRSNVSTTNLYNWLEKDKRGTLMRKQNKHYTLEDKIEIINFYKKFGVKATKVKYQISHSTFYKWKEYY